MVSVGCEGKGKFSPFYSSAFSVRKYLWKVSKPPFDGKETSSPCIIDYGKLITCLIASFGGRALFTLKAARLVLLREEDTQWHINYPTYQHWHDIRMLFRRYLHSPNNVTLVAVEEKCCMSENCFYWLPWRCLTASLSFIRVKGSLVCFFVVVNWNSATK